MDSSARRVPDGPLKTPGAAVRFGVFEFDLKTGELFKAGRRVRLSGQPAQILVLLLRQPGELVTREELQQELWPADTHVNFEQSLNAAMKRLRQALGDSPDKPLFIETMARRGYRFIAPASVPGQPALPDKPVQAVIRSRCCLSKTRLPMPMLSIWWMGITEAIINALSRLPALRVLARSTVFRYRGSRCDCRALGRKLGVGAVLLGRVSQRGDELTIRIELVEVQNGWLIWGEQFIPQASEVLLIEAELSAKITEKLRYELAGKSEPTAPARGTRKAPKRTRIT